MVQAHQSEFQTTPNLLPPRAPAIITPAPFRCSAGSEPVLFSTTAHSIHQWQFSSKWVVVPQSKRCQSGHLAWVGACPGAVAGNHPESQVVSIFFLSFGLGANKPVCTLFMSGVQVSHSPPASPTGLQTSQGDLSSQCPSPGLGHPICGLNHSLFREDSESM